MVYRHTGLAAVAVLGFALFQLTALLQPTETGPPWQMVVLAGLLLGGVITWVGLAYRLPLAVVAVINILCIGLVSLRIAAPETMTAFLPSAASFDALRLQLTQAMAIIRNGIEPVIPVSGLVVVTTAVMWATGAVTAYGLNRDRPALAVGPGLVLAAQFATMARTPTGPLRIALFVLLLAGAVLAVTVDERRATAGRMAHPAGAPHQRRIIAPAVFGALSVTLLGSMVAVGTFRSMVPLDGVMDWRATTGLSGSLFGGGVSYNPFISIHSWVVSNTDVPVFAARVTGAVDADRVYFRLLTMEAYQNGQFSAGGRRAEPPGDGGWEDGGHAFSGPIARVTTDVVIDRLQMEWLPAAYSARRVTGDDTLDSALRVRPSDGALLLDGGVSYPSMAYTVESEIPQPDVAALATSNGTLSPLFAAADAAGLSGVPVPAETEFRPEPPDAERYLQLPEDLDPGIAELARQQTTGLVTGFERALALEQWLRSDEFSYTTSIEPGQGADDLAEWLLPVHADRPFYRAGYCENFATAMAVMARTLGIHSRVVLGFTPGEAVPGDTAAVVVRDRNAHAWVELWMPAQGWVRFDPTPRGDDTTVATGAVVATALGFDPVDFLAEVGRPGTTTGTNVPVPPQLADDGAAPAPGELVDTPPPSGGTLPDLPAGTPVVLAALAVALGGIPLVKWWQRRRRMRRLADGDVTAAWEEIVARLTDVGQRPDEALTPAELAEKVGPEMRPLASVYGRAVYGAPGSIAAPHIRTAHQAMEQTTATLTERLSPLMRLVSWYRPGSLVPSRVRRRR